ncbi:MAG: type II secretion system F family protein, partial [Victivallales bacterium]|nr:type II secretion system F family protein [Victivallales bacterium]
MPLFRYKVSDADGTVSEQQFEGDSQQDAARRIQRRGLIPLEYLGDAQGEGASGRLMQKKFNVVEFTDRLVPLLEANIPLERSLGIIADDQDNKTMSTVATELRRGLHEGRKLSDLIRERGTLFPQIYAGVVEAGEEAGALPQVMGELRRFLT